MPRHSNNEKAQQRKAEPCGLIAEYYSGLAESEVEVEMPTVGSETSHGLLYPDGLSYSTSENCSHPCVELALANL